MMMIGVDVLIVEISGHKNIRELFFIYLFIADFCPHLGIFFFSLRFGQIPLWPSSGD